MTITEIRSDLNEISYYYGMIDLFTEGAKVAPSKSLEFKLKKYNEAIYTAPARLYAIYIARYVQHRTQSSLAEDWACSEAYIQRLNKQLYKFFKEYFDKTAPKEEI